MDAVSDGLTVSMVEVDAAAARAALADRLQFADVDLDPAAVAVLAAVVAAGWRPRSRRRAIAFSPTRPTARTIPRCSAIPA